MIQNLHHSMAGTQALTLLHPVYGVVADSLANLIGTMPDDGMDRIGTEFVCRIDYVLKHGSTCEGVENLR
jgi:hypothetical protein